MIFSIGIFRQPIQPDDSDAETSPSLSRKSSQASTGSGNADTLPSSRQTSSMRQPKQSTVSWWLGRKIGLSKGDSSEKAKPEIPKSPPSLPPLPPLSNADYIKVSNQPSLRKIYPEMSRNTFVPDDQRLPKAFGLPADKSAIYNRELHAAITDALSGRNGPFDQKIFLAHKIHQEYEKRAPGIFPLLLRKENLGVLRALEQNPDLKEKFLHTMERPWWCDEVKMTPQLLQLMIEKPEVMSQSMPPKVPAKRSETSEKWLDKTILNRLHPKETTEAMLARLTKESQAYEVLVGVYEQQKNDLAEIGAKIEKDKDIPAAATNDDHVVGMQKLARRVALHRADLNELNARHLKASALLADNERQRAAIMNGPEKFQAPTIELSTAAIDEAQVRIDTLDDKALSRLKIPASLIPEAAASLSEFNLRVTNGVKHGTLKSAFLRFKHRKETPSAKCTRLAAKVDIYQAACNRLEQDKVELFNELEVRHSSLDAIGAQHYNPETVSDAVLAQRKALSSEIASFQTQVCQLETQKAKMLSLRDHTQREVDLTRSLYHLPQPQQRSQVTPSQIDQALKKAAKLPINQAERDSNLQIVWLETKEAEIPKPLELSGPDTFSTDDAEKSPIAYDQKTLVANASGFNTLVEHLHHQIDEFHPSSKQAKIYQLAAKSQLEKLQVEIKEKSDAVERAQYEIGNKTKKNPIHDHYMASISEAHRLAKTKAALNLTIRDGMAKLHSITYDWHRATPEKAGAEIDNGDLISNKAALSDLAGLFKEIKRTAFTHAEHHMNEEFVTAKIYELEMANPGVTRNRPGTSFTPNNSVTLGFSYLNGIGYAGITLNTGDNFTIDTDGDWNRVPENGVQVVATGGKSIKFAKLSGSASLLLNKNKYFREHDDVNEFTKEVIATQAKGKWYSPSAGPKARALREKIKNAADMVYGKGTRLTSGAPLYPAKKGNKGAYNSALLESIAKNFDKHRGVDEKDMENSLSQKIKTAFPDIVTLIEQSEDQALQNAEQYQDSPLKNQTRLYNRTTAAGPSKTKIKSVNGESVEGLSKETTSAELAQVTVSGTARLGVEVSTVGLAGAKISGTGSALIKRLTFGAERTTHEILSPSAHGNIIDSFAVIGKLLTRYASGSPLAGRLHFVQELHRKQDALQAQSEQDGSAVKLSDETMSDGKRYYGDPKAIPTTFRHIIENPSTEKIKAIEESLRLAKIKYKEFITQANSLLDQVPKGVPKEIVKVQKQAELDKMLEIFGTDLSAPQRALYNKNHKLAVIHAYDMFSLLLGDAEVGLSAAHRQQVKHNGAPDGKGNICRYNTRENSDAIKEAYMAYDALKKIVEPAYIKVPIDELLMNSILSKNGVVQRTEKALGLTAQAGFFNTTVTSGLDPLQALTDVASNPLNNTASEDVADIQNNYINLINSSMQISANVTGTKKNVISHPNFSRIGTFLQGDISISKSEGFPLPLESLTDKIIKTAFSKEEGMSNSRYQEIRTALFRQLKGIPEDFLLNAQGTVNIEARFHKGVKGHANDPDPGYHLMYVSASLAKSKGPTGTSTILQTAANLTLTALKAGQSVGEHLLPIFPRVTVNFNRSVTAMKFWILGPALNGHQTALSYLRAFICDEKGQVLDKESVLKKFSNSDQGNFILHQFFGLSSVGDLVKNFRIYSDKTNPEKPDSFGSYDREPLLAFRRRAAEEKKYSAAGMVDEKGAVKDPFSLSADDVGKNSKDIDIDYHFTDIDKDYLAALPGYGNQATEDQKEALVKKHIDKLVAKYSTLKTAKERVAFLFDAGKPDERNTLGGGRPLLDTYLGIVAHEKEANRIAFRLTLIPEVRAEANPGELHLIEDTDQTASPDWAKRLLRRGPGK